MPVSSMRISRGVIEFAVLVFIALGFFILDAQTAKEVRQVQYEADLSRTEEVRRGCESTNAGVRLPVFKFFDGAIEKIRKVDVPNTTGSAHDAAVASLAGFKDRRQEMVDAVASVAKAPGSPEVDCEERYSLPAPPE